MNEELQKIIIEMLQGTKDFVITEAPDVIQQYLQAEFIESICVLFISFCIFVVAIFFYKKGKKKFLLAKHDNDLAAICYIISYLLALVSFVIFSFYISTPIKIKMAPKGYLLEQVMGHKCR